jgi:hypothetical protein
MRRIFFAGLFVFAGALCLLAQSPTQVLAADKADDKKKKDKDEYEEAKFVTFDQVEIKGRFYPGAKKKQAPAVLLLTKIGADIDQEGWDRLALALKTEGYSVLMFDYRGHEKSKNISPDFWKAPNNRTLKGAMTPNPKDTIDYKEFPTNYFPNLVNDIMAARLYLDRKNDAGECNSADLILIGAEDGACLGALWMYSEWYRYHVNAVGKQDAKPEGNDIACAVWLSYKSQLGGTAEKSGGYIKPNPSDWFRFVGREKKVPMAFMYAEGDKPGEDFSNNWVNFIKNKDGKEHGSSLTRAKAIEKADKTVGSELLQKNLPTQDNIIAYLNKVMGERTGTEWTPREVDKNAYVWSIPGSGFRPPIAKVEKQKDFNLLPIQYLVKP